MERIEYEQSLRLLKVVRNIASELEISTDQLAVLVGCGVDELTSEGEPVALIEDCLRRMSWLIRIYKALHRLFPDSQQANRWLQRANDQFGGETAVSILLSDPQAQLQAIAEYLEYQLV